MRRLCAPKSYSKMPASEKVNAAQKIFLQNVFDKNAAKTL